MRSRSAFTLIELLVVIAIIAILAVVVVLTLNPAELLRQSRDANRVSDMATLNSGINLYVTDQGALAIGNSSTSYLSIPSASSTCGTLGLPSSSIAYACASSSTYRNVNTTGWIPINFPSMSAGTPFGSLPVDPTNQTSGNLYYTYQNQNGVYLLSSFMESQKYAKSTLNSPGNDPGLFQIGTGASSITEAGRGLVGYWPLDAATGSSTPDLSGNGNTGAWTGTATGTAGTYYAPGQVGSGAGDFDGVSTTVTISDLPYTKSLPFSVAVWIYPRTTSAGGVINKYISSSWDGFNLFISGNALVAWYLRDMSHYVAISQQGGVGSVSGYALSPNTWVFVVVTVSNSGMTMYINGSQYATAPWVGTPSVTVESTPLSFGMYSGAFNGLIDDVRIYSRALSSGEIQELYNAEK